MRKIFFVSSFVSLLSIVFAAVTFNKQPFITSGVTCNFDRGWCGWRNVYRGDDFNWKRGSGDDGKQRGTGTTGDHGGTPGGGYLYIKSRRNNNRTARIYSQRITAQVDMCFQFWYFMKGRTLGHLEVLLGLLSPSSGRKPGEKTLWNLKGHQANAWRKANIPLKAGTIGFFIIEAFDWERGRSGNILIDDTDVVASSSSCESVLPSWAAPSTNPATAISTSFAATNSLTTIVPLAAATISTAYSIQSSTQVPQNRTSFEGLTEAPTSSYSASLLPTLSTAGTNVNATTGRKNLNSVNPTWFAQASTANLYIDNSTKIQTLTPHTVLQLLETTNERRTTLGQTSQKSSSSNTASIVAGVTIGVLVLLFLAVALVHYLRKRKQRQFEKNCSVVMTRMYPDITVNTNISFQKLT